MSGDLSELSLTQSDAPFSPTAYFSALSAGGRLTLTPGSPALVDALILAGFSDVLLGASGSVTATKPTFSLAGAPIKLRKRDAGAAAAAPAPATDVSGVFFVDAAKAAWAAVAARDAAGADAGVIDENALLGNEDFTRPAAAADDAAGCAPKRKACANCSCGCVRVRGVLRSHTRGRRNLTVSPTPQFPRPPLCLAVGRKWRRPFLAGC